jgi:cytochrome c biogenesis protein CcmG, thiol:disulfide interchange protein DsbE
VIARVRSHRRCSSRRRVTGVAAVVVASLLVAACGGSGSSADSLPDLALPSLRTDEVLQLDELAGPAVVNLWATWCAPCRRELPDFEEVHRELGDEVRFIGVNIGDRPADATSFLDSLGITFDQYLDVDGALNGALGTATLPVTVVTNAEGEITTMHSGPMDAAELIEAIEKAQASTT